MVLAKAGVETKFLAYLRARIFRVAAEKKNVLIYTFARIAVREDSFLWVWVSIALSLKINLYELKEGGAGTNHY